jgi:hypothetical protein
MLGAIKPMSIWMWLTIKLLYPYILLKAAIGITIVIPDINPIRKGLPLSGNKTGASLQNLDIASMKTYCKKVGCTMNDYTTALIGASFHEYMTKYQTDDNGKSYPIPDYINVLIPFSLRQPARNTKEFKMCNEFVAIPMTIPIKSQFSEVLTGVKKIFSSLRNSPDPYGMFEFFSILVNLPFIIPSFGVHFMANKFTLVYSNLNATKIEFVWDGKKQVGQYYFPPAIGTLCCGVSLSTTGKIMSLAVYSDATRIKHPKELMAIFKRKNEELLKDLKEIKK